MRLPDRLDVLRLRNFRNLYIGEAVSLLGDGLFPVALTFGVLDLHHSGTDVGLVLAAFSLPMVLFTLVGGVWSRPPAARMGDDRLRPRALRHHGRHRRPAARRPRRGLEPRPAGLRLRLRRRLLLSRLYRADPADRTARPPPGGQRPARRRRRLRLVRRTVDLGHPRRPDRRRRDPRHRRRHLSRQRRLPADPARAGAAAHQGAGDLPRRAARRLARGAFADLAVGDDAARHARPVRDHRAAAGARPAGAHRPPPDCPALWGLMVGLFSLGMLVRRADRPVLPAASGRWSRWRCAARPPRCP